MKFTLSWLKDHLETEASLEEIVTTLTRIGLEVESVEDPASRLAGFSIAHVISAVQHPNADKLRVCMVDTGKGEPVQVVCGAPNARTGMKSVFSPPGTYIPAKNITLAVAPVRGVESRGMLCSEFELEISNEHDGIIDLPQDAPVGMPYAEYAGLNDPVIDVGLTPNRPDCTGVAGIARDLAAAGLGRLKTPEIAAIAGNGPCPISISFDFGDSPSLCPGFALRLVRGVKNGPSPLWMQRRLKAIGQRPINKLVDITNYVTFDRGRPLHVFDASKIKGNLVVRRARAGEKILALDGRIHELDDTMCVIVDDDGKGQQALESIAGIMGGEHSGCDENTTDVLIESALWEPLNIARTGRTLGIHTDARYRFERGVDPGMMVPGCDLATRLVQELCGGSPTEKIVIGQTSHQVRTIELPVTEVRRLTGLDTSQEEAAAILARLGFGIECTNTAIKATVPGWRPDIDGKADLVEEIMRITGVDTIAVTPLPRAAHVPLPVLTVLQKRTRLAKRSLAARGMMEAVTWSFISREQAERFGGGQAALALANPIAADLSDMRPSLLPGLIAGGQRNADRGMGDIALFEVGQIFRGDKPEDQKIAAAAIRRGQAHASGHGRTWQERARAPSVFDAKEDAMTLLAALGAPVQSLQIVPGAPSWYHPGRSGTIQLGPQNVIGWFGEIHPNVLELFDADGPVAAFELIVDAIPVPKAKPTKTRGPLELSAFQPVRRDFAFVVDQKIRAADIVKTAQGIDRKLITSVTIFDVYEGKGITEGQKSVALEVVLQPQSRTLTDAEIDAVSARIIAEIGKKTGAVLRA